MALKILAIGLTLIALIAMIQAVSEYKEGKDFEYILLFTYGLLSSFVMCYGAFG